MAVNFNIQFRINATTRVIRLTDTSTGFTYGKGCFYIAFPDGSVRNLPDFTNPDLVAGGPISIDIPCVTDINNNVITGAYTITYAVTDNTSTIQTPLSRQFDFNWIEPSNGITNLSDVVIPEVVFRDVTSYSPIGSFTGTLTRTLSSSFPSTSEASAQTPVSSTSSNTINVVSAVNYYEGVYTPTSAVSITYTHSSNSWLTIFYSRTFSKTFSIKKCPNQLELVAKINTYRGIIDAYKETNDTQFNILSEQYDLVIALYSHLITRYETATQDGSEPILRELLSILEPYTGTYSYQATKMLPFELAASTTNSFSISDGTNTDSVALGSTLLFASGSAALTTIVTNNNVTYSPIFGTALNTFAQGNDARFHNPVTIGTANGLSISTQALSLAAATSGSAGAMSAADKTKLDGIATGATANTGTVTSVGLTAPAAFTVTGSPVITTGTLAIAAAGTSLQYITGAGALATLNTLNVPENTNLYFTPSRARTSISLTTTGTTGAATYDNTTGVLNIPSYIGGVTSFNTRTGAIVLSSADVTTALTYTPVPSNRTLTINGTSFDLSADRSWTIASGVTSFNTRTGAITLTSSDVTTALTYTPYNATNPSAYIALTSLSFAAGSGGYNNTTGVITIPTNNNQITNGAGYITGITSGNVTTALGYTPENAANKGIANGYASLDGGGLVPSTQLPSYVDDVLEYTNLAGFPATGETGKIYVALDNNKIYRWSGSVYIEVSPTVGTIWGGITGTLANQTDLQSALDAKQDDITLTTTGTSGAATFVGNTLNIPQYQGGVTSFNTRTGAITLTSSDVTTALTFTPYNATNPSNYIALTALSAGTGISYNNTTGVITNTITQYTDALARGAISLTTTGTSGAATYNSTTGVLNIPSYQGGVTSFNTRTGAITLTSSDVTTALGYTPVTDARTLTINGTTYDLTANRSWTISGAMPTGGTAGQILSKIDATNYNTQWIDNYATQVKHDVKLGATIAKGKAVYVSSADGTNMIVSAASNALESTSSKVLGLIETGGVTNDIVKVVTEGLIAGLNTSTATAGDPVWLGTGGNLIFGLLNKPVAPANLVFIGVVTRVQSNNGEIFVNVQNGFEMNELHDVLVGSYGTKDVLYRDTTTNLWKNASIASVLGYTPYDAANPSNYIALTALSSTATGLTYTNTTGVFSLTSGYVIPTTSSATNWDTAYTNRITTLTTTGSSGSATLSSNTLNIPTYTLSGLGGQPLSTNLTSLSGLTYASTSFVKMTASGTFALDTNTYYLASNPSSYIALTALSSSATGLTYTNTTGVFSLTSGYVIPTTSSATNWDTAYTNRITSLTTTGSSGAATLVSNTLNIPTYTLAGLGGVPTTRTITINGTTYDLSADRTWTISTNPSARVEQNFIATANQTTFTITGGYVVGLVDVFVNGVRYLPTDYTATNGTTVVLGIGLLAGDAVTILNYTSSIAALPTSRNVQDYTATAAQTTFTVTNGYIVGLIDVFVNGSKLTASEFTATNGTTFVLTIASTLGDQVQSINYTASVNGISGAGTANYVPKFTASGTIGNSNLINDASGNLGVGVTPSAWTAGGRNIEVGSAGNIIQGQASQIAVIQNATFNSGWKYSATGFASFALQTTGQHQWFTAPSGTAGAAITFTQAMTLDASGRLALGGTTITDAHLLNIQGSSATSNIGIVLNKTNSTAQIWGITNVGALTFYNYTSSTESMRITPAGDVSIGTTTPLLTAASRGNLTINGASSNILTLGIAGSYSGYLFSDSTKVELSTSTQPMTFVTNGAERMRITAAGAIGINTSSPNSSTVLTLQESASLSGAISFLNRNSTQRYSIAVDATAVDDKFLAIIDNNTAAVRLAISPAGNVGIGTTSPSAKLDVTGNIRSFISNIGGLGGNISLLNDFGNNGGHTLINMQNAGTICWIKATINGPNSNSGADLSFATPSTDTNGSERMRITSGGELLIGKTSTGLTTNGVVIYNTNPNSGQIFSSIPNSANSYHIWDTTNGAFRFYVSGGGTIFATNTTISSLSDERLKENIQDLDIGLDAIMALRPRKYDWKKESGNSSKNVRGFIAQEVESIFPDLIDEWRNDNKDGNATTYKSLRQDFIPILVKAIQEQQSQIEELKTLLKA